jgi:hypothetical protein
MPRKRHSKSQTRRHSTPQKAKQVKFQHWRERVDRPLEVLICVGHIAAIVGLLIEHLS